MSKVDVLKRFFGDVRPVANKEILELRKADPVGYDEMAQSAAIQMGVSIDGTAEVVEEVAA